MKVFVAGGTGAIGRYLVPQLVEAGHVVVAMTRSSQKAPQLEQLGAQAVVADGLDPSAVGEAISRAEPEVVIHQMTALASIKSMRSFDKEFTLTNRLRTEGTDNLLAAARAAGVRRFLAQSYAGWNYEPAGPGLKTEEDPIVTDPPANQRRSLEAILHLESQVLGAEAIEGVVLRYGSFYGTGTGIAEDGVIAELVRKRRLPVIGEGGGVWSFAHVDDAAAATVAAVENGAPGIYNVVDDHPAAVADWLPELARVLGAKRPWRVPAWLGRIAAGEVGVSMMTETRGVSNAKAKRELRWEPRYPSYREGFRDGLGAASATLGGPPADELLLSLLAAAAG